MSAVMILVACALRTPIPSPLSTTTPTVTPTVKGTQLPTPILEPTAPTVAFDRLAFANEEGIHLVSPDGSDLVPLVVFSEQFSIGQISWSSDGQRLAYVTYADCSVTECSPPGANTTLYVVNADGTAHHKVTSWQSRGAPSDLSWRWSPDSRYALIYQGSDTHGLFYSIVNVETAETVCQYYSMRYPSSDDEYYEIAYCDPFRLSNDRWWSIRHDIVLDTWDHVWGLRQGPLADVTTRYFSPDGQWVILLAYDQDKRLETSAWYIARMNGDEGFQILSDISEHRSSVRVAWSRDSQSFAILSRQDDLSFIWTGHADDQAVSLLAELGPSGCGGVFGWSASGHHISCGEYAIDWPSGQMHLVGEEPWSPAGWSSERDCLLLKGQAFQVWDADRNRLIPLGDEIGECKWASDGPWLACWSETTVTVFNLLEQDTIRADIAGIGVLEWSPSGRWVGFCTHEWVGETLSHSLYTVDTVTHQIAQIMGKANSCDIAWYPVLVEDE
jgi:dipeptidyl aminopeptidase/acylaminoacyl peptidase